MNKLSVFATGTMRSGGSLFQNFMSVHSEVIIFSGFVNFFRFYDEKYGKMNSHNLKKILGHLNLRLKYRRNFDLDIDSIFINLKDKPNLTYADCYRGIMEHLKEKANKKIWGEYVTMGWRKIPKYLDYFPNGKAIHIIRDPRAVLTSFGKMSIMPEGYYLNSIFNWIDSYNYSKSYEKQLSKDRYKIVKFEDIHKSPENEIRLICDFMEIKFQKNMINSETWKSLFDENFVNANISVYTKEKVYGFDINRTTNWRNNIKDHELFICDILLNQFNNNNESFTSGVNYDLENISENLEIISKYPLFYNALQKYNLNKKGNDKHVIDPTKPENWDSDNSQTGKFIDSKDYDLYVKKFNEIMNS